MRSQNSSHQPIFLVLTLLVPACGDPCLDDGLGAIGEVCETELAGDDGEETAGDGSDSGMDGGMDGAGDGTLYCLDDDMDGFGDPNDCEEVPDGDEPPEGHVPNADDCDDASANTYPGAAENEEGCMADEDGDGWGDSDPSNPDVEPGSDCDDSNDDAFPGAAEKEENADACMEDADGDGFGDTMPSDPETTPGTDCDDENEHAFPGAAENEDDPSACMEDEDMDGYGDSTPDRPETTPGSDCDDGDPTVFGCTLWCADADMDGYGDPNMCVPVPEGEEPPPGLVQNAGDCVDTNADIFPGAASEEPELCTIDQDGDGYGDEDASLDFPGAEDGTDCLDTEPGAFPGAAEEDDPEACMLDGDGDGWGDLDPPEGVSPGRDCNDGDQTAVVCVDVSPSCAETQNGEGTLLEATAWGGVPEYTWLWDNADTLDDATLQSPTASPTEITTYTVTVTDSAANQGTDEVTVHITDKPWVLGGDDAECEAVEFMEGADDEQPNHVFSEGGTVACNTVNAVPSAFVCPTVHEDVRIVGKMSVQTGQDDDWVGFVWGWQDSDRFYLFEWKQSNQNAFGGANCGVFPAGMMVKKFDKVEDYAWADFGCAIDTPNQEVLLTPLDTGTVNLGWQDNREYDVVLEYQAGDTQLTIVDSLTQAQVAQFTVEDEEYTNGRFGTFDASQNAACNGPWGSSCL